MNRGKTKMIDSAEVIQMLLECHPDLKEAVKCGDEMREENRHLSVEKFFDFIGVKRGKRK